ncbi:hypothetical protein ABT369_33245 [Dactylosporangium sp. NPDC000244]|uniref:hypothetical protein n=1 Tax=Dactylosporangium sp. NPDC000244 TaxID=3154365 RepID=UPI003322E6C9
MAGFSYKTSWLAVRSRTAEDVADALGLHDREVLDWATGTERAYQHGVYVAAPLSEWTLAHGRRHLPAGFDAADPRFCEWLRQLSRDLGEVQYFANERVSDYYVWARARDGEVLRAYCCIGERGEVPLFVGDPTDDEVEIGKGTRGGPGAGRETWSDEEWAAWFAAMPSEGDVMVMAGRWSVDPAAIDDSAVTAAGIHGLPPTVRHTARVRETAEPSHGDEAGRIEADAAFWRRFRAGGKP